MVYIFCMYIYFPEKKIKINCNLISIEANKIFGCVIFFINNHCIYLFKHICQEGFDKLLFYKKYFQIYFYFKRYFLFWKYPTVFTCFIWWLLLQVCSSRSEKTRMLQFRTLKSFNLGRTKIALVLCWLMLFRHKYC